MGKHRPEFPIGVVLTPGIISRIRSDQEYYDRDPERAEREYEAREERRRLEREREREAEEEFYRDLQRREEER